MKRTLSLLVGMALAAILCVSMLQAQAIVPNANDTRPGGQLFLYYDAVRYDVVYLTLTNTGLSTVRLHMILIGEDCAEQLDWQISLCPGGHKIYDMSKFDLGSGRGVDFRGTRGILLATPTSSTGTDGIAPAVPYNHLAGNTVHAHLARGNSFGVNALSRLAVDGNGAPLADFAGVLDGVTKMFQRIQPTKLWHDGFYALSTVTDSRMLLFSFNDLYSPTFYEIGGASITLNNFAGRADCARVSLTPKTFTCYLDTTIQSYIGGGYGSFFTASGTLEMTPLAYGPNQNFMGIASQTVNTFTTNRYMWGK